MLNKTTKPKKTNNNYKKESYLTLTQVFRRLLFCRANCGVFSSVCSCNIFTIVFTVSN